MTVKRLTYTAARTATLEQCTVQQPGRGQVLVQTLYSGISRGTESLVFNGLVPACEHQRMRCPHQQGSFTYPVSYGYAAVGEIVATGPESGGYSPGDRVFCLHPHQDLFVADTGFCHPIPDGLALHRAVLAANAETALNAVWDSELPDSGNTCVIGAGVVGLLTAFIIARMTGTRPIVIDINPLKQKVTEHLGLEFMTTADAAKGNLPPPDRVFNTSASQEGLQLALDLAAFEAVIVEMSWYGERSVDLKLGGNFHSGRLHIISSQVGHVSATRRNRVSHQQRMQQALAYLKDTRLDALLEPAIDFEDLPTHLPGIFADRADVLCQLVRYKNTT